VAVESLGIDRSGSFVIYTIIGGVQTIFGPVAGTAIIMYLESVLSARVSYWRLLEGVIFVAVIVFMPAGIVGTLMKRRRSKSRDLLAASVGRAAPGAPSA
jgi:branched-chain amino acid transport system permease protein